MTNPTQALANLGQSVWLDDLRRDYLDDGSLARLICEDGLSGITSNPAIFEHAIESSSLYEKDIARLARAGATAQQMYEALIIADIRRAADMLQPTHYSAKRFDGFVSLEVSPELAYDAEATIAEAMRLWNLVQRPNLLIKVPGTEPGLAAIRTLTARGINVNVTLLFSVARYLRVADAFMSGLEDRGERGEDIGAITSVASFFLSRIDTLVDRRLDASEAAVPPGLRGSAAIACAKLAFAKFREYGSESRWRQLADRGARPQRLLWASTGTKDPAYGDVKYVEALIGPETVVTMPLATLLAYRDHGRPAERLEDDLAEAQAVPDRLASLGIDLEEIARELEGEGVQKFVGPFDALLSRLESERSRFAAEPPRRKAQ